MNMKTTPLSGEPTDEREAFEAMRQLVVNGGAEIGRLHKAIETFLDALDEKHDSLPAPQKYGVPYGAVNALRAAFSHSDAAPAVTLGGLSIDDINPPKHLHALVAAAWNHHLPDLRTALADAGEPAQPPADLEKENEALRLHIRRLTKQRDALADVADPIEPPVQQKGEGLTDEMELRMDAAAAQFSTITDYTNGETAYRFATHEHLRSFVAALASPSPSAPGGQSQAKGDVQWELREPLRLALLELPRAGTRINVAEALNAMDVIFRTALQQPGK